MGRPPLPEDKRRKSLHVRVEPETLERVQELSKELDVSQSVVVDRAVAAFKPRK